MHVENLIFKNAVKSAKFNFLGQIFFRVVSFLLNVFIIRYISKDILGIVNVRLMLLYSTVIFLSTEGFRRTCIAGNINNKSKIVNILWLCVPLNILLNVIFSYIWTSMLTPPNPNLIPYYVISVYLYSLATFIESISQVFYILSLICHYVTLKTYFESFSLIVKNIIILYMIIQYPQNGLLNFAVCQIIYSSCLTFSYVIYFIWRIYSHGNQEIEFFHEYKELLPSFKFKLDQEEKRLLELTWSFSYQSLMKQFLTEGERFVMTFFDIMTFAQQGIYDLVNGLASLVARMVYLPIEDSAYLYFTQTSTREPLSPHPIEYSQNSKTINSSKPLPQEIERDDSYEKLIDLLSLMTTIGLLVITFGLAYSELALRLYMGSSSPHSNQYDTINRATSLLQLFCLYLFILGINGITECYTFAIYTKANIDNFNKILIVLSLIFLMVATPLGRLLGPPGLVIANCLNISIRIVYASCSITRKKGVNMGSFYRSFFPSTYTLSYLAICTIVCNLSNYFLFKNASLNSNYSPTLLNYVSHISIGAIMSLSALFLIYASDKKLVRFIESCYFSEHRKKTN